MGAHKLELAMSLRGNTGLGLFSNAQTVKTLTTRTNGLNAFCKVDGHMALGGEAWNVVI